MKIRKYFENLCFLNVYLTIFAVNHWVLNENGIITKKIDSPFYLREPNDLIAFLDQIKHNNIIESTYLELIRQRELMSEQINFSIQYGMNIIEQANCALKFYEVKNPLKFTKITKKYLKRISLKKFYESQDSEFNSNTNNYKEKLYCSQYLNLSAGICCYDHIKSLQNPKELHIEPEKDIELDFHSKNYITNLIIGLKTNPNSWKYHTLSSFYWRMMGDAEQAIACAKRGLMLAPRKFRDIPLLSLGTILLRSSKLKDALIMITSAADHASHVPENHFALGVINAMLDNYNHSVKHFNQAEKLDSTLIPKTKNLKEFINCYEVINSKTSKMNSYVEFIKREVHGLKTMKNKIVASHEKLIQQQIPIGARDLTSFSNNELLNRGQYCSTKTLSGSNEPILFCDFYSDLQMRLQSKEVDIDSLEAQLTTNSEAIIKRLSVDFHRQFEFKNDKKKS